MELSKNEVDLNEFFNVIIDGKWFIGGITAFISIIAIVYSLSLPNIYKSSALLVVEKNSSDSLSGALGSYSGIANLTGITLPTGGNISNKKEAIEKINSLSFFENYIMPNILLPELMAVKSWNSDSNELIFDKKIYNKKSNIWTRDVSSTGYKIPTIQESYAEFHEEHLYLSEDAKTGFVTLSIKHQSPYVAKKWVELFVDKINLFYREKDKKESMKAISYLNERIGKTSYTEIKQAIASLIQVETQKLTMIEVNEFYVFDYIDPPAVMEHKAEPKRALICILGAILGTLLGSIMVLVNHYKNHLKIN